MDRGFYVGDSVFEVERTFGGKSFRMKEHVDRLYRSLKYARIDAGLSQPGQYLKTKRCAADRGVLQLVEPGGKAIVATYLSVKSVDHG